jgi:polyisoprenoid-binding protein YceI
MMKNMDVSGPSLSKSSIDGFAGRLVAERGAAMKSSTKNKIYIGAVALAISLLFVVPSDAYAGEKYVIDPDHSSLGFKVLHFGLGHVYGRFNQFSGDFIVDIEDPSKSSVNVKVKAASVDSNQAKRDQHLKSPDFLNAKQFPVITFESTSAKKIDSSTAEVTGKLTLRGITKTIKARVERVGAGKDPWGNQRLGLETTFTINRSEFGVKFMPQGISEKVELTLAVEGILQKDEKHARAD